MLDVLVGNQHIKSALRRLLQNGRVPHSLILAGEEGIGKRQFALQLAKSLICLEPSDRDACDVCAACKRAGEFALPRPDDKDTHERIVFSSHPDVGTVIAYNRNILVKAIRHLESEANFLPYEARARIFVVDDADKMNDAASNALLKTLEEPPETSYLFLVTSRPDSLLGTIRSRCQMLKLAPIDVNEIEHFLISDRAFSHDEARFASALSRGSLARALKINVSRTREMREKLLTAVENAIGVGDRALLLRMAEEINDAKNKENFEDTLDLLQSLIHDIWSLNVGGDESRLVNCDIADRLQSAAASVGLADLPSWIRNIDAVRENLGVNINRKIAADALFLTMAN